jgi:hypothetical protein
MQFSRWKSSASARDAIDAVATRPFSAVQRPSDCSTGPARSRRCQQVPTQASRSCTHSRRQCNRREGDRIGRNLRSLRKSKQFRAFSSTHIGRQYGLDRLYGLEGVALPNLIALALYESERGLPAPAAWAPSKSHARWSAILPLPMARDLRKEVCVTTAVGRQP